MDPSWEMVSEKNRWTEKPVAPKFTKQLSNEDATSLKEVRHEGPRDGPGSACCGSACCGASTDRLGFWRWISDILKKLLTKIFGSFVDFQL